MTAYRVGIIGGGASGALVAARLLRDATTPMEIVIFEPRDELALGVAYETPDPLHLLNVPARNMSALVEDDDHFRRWANCAPNDFVTRTLYGEYLQALLHDAEAGAADGVTLTHVQDAVTNVGGSPRPWLTTTRPDTQNFDRIVIATGHDEPVLPAVLVGLPSERVTGNPWQVGALDGIADGDDVLIIGTGLTFVDVALTILNRTPQVRIHAISRSGLLPQAHEDPWRPAHPVPDLPVTEVDPRVVLDYVLSFGDDWRRGIDSLRSITASLWLGMSPDDRESFVRHLARYWNVHRHRMAPEVARQFDAFLVAGQIELQEASVSTIASTQDGLHVELSNGASLDVAHVVLCTGPSGDMSRNYLGRNLIQDGVAQPGPLGVGYLIDPLTGALITGTGESCDELLTLGPIRRGVLWESIAMPEVRVQAADVSRSILESAQASVFA